MDFKHRPGWTSYAERWIDLDRGTSAYSKAMNRRQGLFFYKKTDAKLIKIWPHLNTTQSMEYIASNVFCHYSMLSIRQRYTKLI